MRKGFLIVLSCWDLPSIENDLDIPGPSKQPKRWPISWSLVLSRSSPARQCRREVEDEGLGFGARRKTVSQIHTSKQMDHVLFISG